MSYIVRLRIPHIDGDDLFLFDINRLVIKSKRRKWHVRLGDPYEFKTLSDAKRAFNSGISRKYQKRGRMAEILDESGDIVWPKNVLDKLAEVIDDMDPNTTGNNTQTVSEA